jgi:hypothetical protein
VTVSHGKQRETKPAAWILGAVRVP